MHIPDGFLSTPVWLALDAAGAPAAVYLARAAQREVDSSRIPLLGVMGAFVFAAQMINFPVGAGASGHLVGSALLAYALGPASASVVMTAILAVQALVFQDGGVLALGANVMNMAVAGVFAGYLPVLLWGRGRWRPAAIVLGGMLSVLTAALLAIAELALSGIPIPGAVLGISLALFLATAVLEGVITLAVMKGIEALNPGWVWAPAGGRRTALAALGGAALVLAGAGFAVASVRPDGLEKMAESLGVSSHARTLMNSPLADYQAAVPGPEWLGKAAAGLAGLALVAVVCFVWGKAAARRRSG